MQLKAYVLIEVNSGQTKDAVAQLQSISGVTRVDQVTGPYDLIATVEAADARELGRIITEGILFIPAVKRAISCLVV